MRNLTIKRAKSFVACLAKMRVFVEDPLSDEIVIQGVSCRKLGDLKNGEEKTFAVENSALKVFVIGDRLSKDLCCEYYQLPEGDTDITLSGKNAFSPTTGNAFLFDNNDSEEMQDFHKQRKKKGLGILIPVIIVSAIVGFISGLGLFSSKPAEAKTYSSNGMSITLTDEFTEMYIEGYTRVYDSRKVAVFALKEGFSLMDGFEDYTLNEYADLVIQANALTSVTPQTVSGLTLFEYEHEDPNTQTPYHYYCFVFKSKDAFWTIQFATETKDATAYETQIFEWASSVTFSK